MAMLFVGRTQMSKDQICKMFGVDLKKILKNPSFEVAKHRQKIDRVNGGVLKSGKGMGSRSHFMATDPTTNMKVEIRYAESHVPKAVGNTIMDVFEPRYVQFMGTKKAFQNDPELAIYWFLHPNNSLSPLRDAKNKTKPKIEYIDNKKRAQAQNNEIDALTNALTHSTSVPYDQLVVLAKGLGLKGVHGKEEDEVRGIVRKFAATNPKIYNEKILSRLTSYEGKIYHFVDLGIFNLKTIGGIRRWSWAKGQKEGETILDIVNSTQDAKAALKNHIFNDMNSWMYLLDNIHEAETASEKAEAFLRSQEPVIEAVNEPVQVVGDQLPDYLKNVNNDTPVVKMESFQDALAYLTERDGKRPANPVASKFLKDFQEGLVTL